MRVVGVDGCRGGWLAAVDDAGAVSWVWTRDIRELLALSAAAVAIDIPIGLPETGRRGCDVAARELLGSRRATVFFAPVRPVLGCASYAEARALLADRGGPSMSAQAFGIVAAVRAVDAALSPADSRRVIEAHPELAFLRLTGATLPAKKSAQGHDARVEALARVWPDVADLVATAPGRAAPDDALDALACAWVARRWAHGDAAVVGDGRCDARGLPMRIVS